MFVDVPPAVRLVIENLARNANFEGMEGVDIDELLNAEQNITNKDLIDMELKRSQSTFPKTAFQFQKKKTSRSYVSNK